MFHNGTYRTHMLHILVPHHECTRLQNSNLQNFTKTRTCESNYGAGYYFIKYKYHTGDHDYQQ